MSSSANTIIKNAGALLGSQLITWALTMVLTIFLPRYLGPSGVGELQFAGAIWAILNVVISFGMETLLVKEIAREPAKAQALLGRSLAVRSTLFVLSCIAVGIYLWLSNATFNVVALVYIVGISTLVAQYVGASGAVLRGLERMEYISLSGIANKLVNTILGIAVLLLGYGVYGVAFVAIFGGILALIIQLFSLRQQAGIKPVFAVAPSETVLQAGGAMLRAGSPYLLTGLAVAIYGQVDTLIIHSLVDTATLGWYSVTMQLSGTLLFLPVVLTTAVFPALARSHSSQSSQMSGLFGKSFDLLLVVAVPIGFGALAISDQLMPLIYGPDFAAAGPVFAVMGVVTVLFFQNILLAQFLISADRQNVWTIITIVATVVTVLLDLYLVPLCQRWYGNGAIGGALSYVITETAMLVAAIASLPRGMLSRANAWAAARTLVAGLGMVGACWLVRDWFIVVPVIVGAVTYVALVLSLQVVPPEDIRHIGAILRGVVARLRARFSPSVATEGVKS